MLVVNACSASEPVTIVDVEMTLPDTVAFAPDGFLDAEIRVTNRGTQEVSFSRHPCPAFWIIDERGVAWSSSIPCTLGGASEVRLERGESAVFPGRWFARTSPLARGRFGLQSAVAPIGGDRVYSNVVPIRIDDAPTP